MVLQWYSWFFGGARGAPVVLMVLRWCSWCSSGTHGSPVVLMVLQWYSWLFGGAYGAPVVLMVPRWCLWCSHVVLLVFSCAAVFLVLLVYIINDVSGPILLQVLRTVSEMEDDGEASHEAPNHKEKTIPPISTEETDGKRNCSCCVLINPIRILYWNRIGIADCDISNCYWENLLGFRTLFTRVCFSTLLNPKRFSQHTLEC